VLNSLDPLHIVPGLFLLDKQVIVHDDGRTEIDADLSTKLDAAVSAFAAALARAAHPWPKTAG
jgi:hypothetical protein